MNNEEAAKRNLADVVRQKRSANASSDEHSARKSDVLLKTHDHSDVLVFFARCISPQDML